MKSVGEVMAIGRTFQESFQKALRGLEVGVDGLNEKTQDREVLEKELGEPGPDRIWYVGDAFGQGMSVDEVPVILDLIQRLKDEGQRTILLVEHKMDVIRSLADRIIVFHNGQLVADGEPAAVMASPVVQEAYMGAKVAVHA